MTIAELESMFEGLRKTSPREAAEVAFVLVSRYRENAKEIARVCISIFDGLKARDELKTEGDCTTRFGTLGGVVIPKIIHEGIARDRFRLWGVKL